MKTRRYRRKTKRGGEPKKSCRQNENDWRQHWNPSTSKRGAIPMHVKKQCCEKFDKNTRYYGAWNIMKGARYPEINGMNGACDGEYGDTYIPQHADINNYTEASILKDPYSDILPTASISVMPPKPQTMFKGDVPNAVSVSSSKAPFATVVNTPTYDMYSGPNLSDQERLQNFLYR